MSRSQLKPTWNTNPLRPWDDEWEIFPDMEPEITDGGVAMEQLIVINGPPAPGGDIMTVRSSNSAEVMTARAKLVSAAPDLVRALLQVEWVYDGECDAEVVYRCPWCRELREVRKDDAVGGRHRDDCTREMVLQKAGVR